jgi:hypothetical protein
VKGIVPPGRKLSDAPRARVWQGSGIEGVTPPGTQEPEAPKKRRALESPIQKREKKSKKDAKPVAASSSLPLQGLLDRFAAFTRENLEPTEELMRDLARDILQTHAPFEIVVGFTVLSALVGADEALRRTHHLPLERGAKAFYNLGKRLDPKVRAPRGLVPQTLDPLFFDVPDLAFQLPEPFVVQAFGTLLDFLQTDPDHDRALIAFVLELRKEYVLGRKFGDQSMERMFPWTEPDWAPEPE